MQPFRNTATAAMFSNQVPLNGASPLQLHRVLMPAKKKIPAYSRDPDLWYYVLKQALQLLHLSNLLKPLENL